MSNLLNLYSSSSEEILPKKMFMLAKIVEYYPGIIGATDYLECAFPEIKDV